MLVVCKLFIQKKKDQTPVNVRFLNVTVSYRLNQWDYPMLISEFKISIKSKCFLITHTKLHN